MEVKLSFGAELEWSDIDRTIDIPPELGSWEGPKVAGRHLGSEIDIVNTRGKWAGVATDPLAIDCPVGGEIHTVPSYTAESQLVRIMRILDLFPTVAVACPNHGHIHVGIPGILNPENLDLLKNLFRYTRMNEETVLDCCCGLTRETIDKILLANLQPWVTEYMICGDAKKISPELYDRIEEASSPEQVLSLLNGIECLNYTYREEEGRPFSRIYMPSGGSHRTAVNLYNLTRMESVEFRCFRASLNPEEIYSCLKFSELYIREALKGYQGRPAVELLKDYHFIFPDLGWDSSLAEGWQNTRKSKGRSGPFKKSSGILRVTEDPILINEEATVFDEALAEVTKLCVASFRKLL